MNGGPRRVAVVGVGGSTIERRSVVPIGALALDAVRSAIADAGLDPGQIDGMATYADTHLGLGRTSQDGVDVVSVHLLARQLGISPSVRWMVMADDFISTAFVDAVNAVAAGVCETCVVFRAMHNPGKQKAASAGPATGSAQFLAPYGIDRGWQAIGAAYGRYLHQYGGRREDMGCLLATTRAHASRNPRAYFRDVPLTVDGYMSSRMLTDTVCLLDCDIPVDGAAALVLTTADRARDLPQAPAYVAGYAQSVGHAGFNRSHRLRLGPPLADIQEASAITMDKLWRTTGLSPADVSVAQIYDGFSFFIYWWLEGAGLCHEGEAHELARDGHLGADGPMPVNTFGGQLGEGRLHGIGHLAEAALQAAGRAGPRQIASAEVSLAIVGPPFSGSAAILFTRS
jgi:acetyl-CoA acetyltransferase